MSMTIGAADQGNGIHIELSKKVRQVREKQELQDTGLKNKVQHLHAEGKGLKVDIKA